MTQPGRVPANRRRLFFALWPDSGIAEAMATQARQIAAGGQGRAMRADSLHVTLAFLGDVNASVETRLLEACDRVSLSCWPDGFRVCLDRLEYWRHNEIVAATSSERAESSRQLEVLLGDLSRSCAIKLPDRPFVPHLTLVRNCRIAPPGLECEVANRWTLHARSFRLVWSRLDPSGSRFQTLGEWPSGPGSSGATRAPR
jgi:2'-5' RNA ligase